jgi:teichuronic acid biosynthesis glycosyltransferase TuaC
MVLFVGNLLPAKGVRELVEAVAGLDRSVRLDLVGGGPEAGHGSTDPRLVGRVTYHGQRPPDEVPVWLSAADVLVLPSHREGLPTILVEAGSLGVPVIASAVGGIPELLGADRGLVLPDTSPATIAAAVRAVGEDPDGARQRAERLRGHVEREYDARVNAGRLADLYAGVVAASPRPPR